MYYQRRGVQEVRRGEIKTTPMTGKAVSKSHRPCRVPQTQRKQTTTAEQRSHIVNGRGQSMWTARPPSAAPPVSSSLAAGRVLQPPTLVHVTTGELFTKTAGCHHRSTARPSHQNNFASRTSQATTLSKRLALFTTTENLIHLLTAVQKHKPQNYLPTVNI